jgi:hypothetical protein
MRSVLLKRSAVGAIVGFASLAGAAHAEEAPTLIDAIEGGDLILELRPRLETLDQAGVADADAFTMRTRLGWKTATWNGFTGLIEFEDVRDLGGDYNDGIPPAEPYATIADPQGAELNRLQLSWRMNEHFTATLGRQTIEFDDKRFVDQSNSRQDARTLDAVRGDFSLGNFRATYAYVDHVNNATAEFNDFDTETHLLNVSQAFSPAFKLTGFYYAFDFEPPGVVNQSSRFIGVRGTGRVEAAGARFDYAASYANQEDYGGSTVNFELDYWQSALTATHGEWSGRLWYESLEGDGVRGFFTPLGSSNNFHGWAGAFVTKPADGLNDFNATISYTPAWAPDFLEELTFLARWYEFESERTGVDLGDDLDLAVSANLTEQLSFGADYGDYRAGDASSPAERTRVRVWLEFKL